MWAPRVEQTEALKLMVEKFVDCIGNGGRSVNDGMAGLRVVKLLEAATKSLKNKGEMVYL
jgi:predicted dehydrogenase